MSTPTLSGGTPESGAETDKRRSRRPWLIALFVVLGLAVVYLLLGLFSGRIVAPGTTVAGVDIGGKSASDASTTLEDALADPMTQDIELTAGESTATLKPGDAGIGVDVDLAGVKEFARSVSVTIDGKTIGGSAAI